MRRVPALAGVVGASVLLWAGGGEAGADLVRFTFTGTVIAVTGEGPPPPEAEIGAAFTVSFVFDTGAVDSDPGGNFGFYDGAVQTASAESNGLVVSATGGYVSVLNNGFVGDTLFYESVTEVYRVQASLTDIHRTAIDGDALPGDVDFPQWESNRFYLGDVVDGAWTIVGEITGFEREEVGGGCAADWSGDGEVNSGDISAFLTSWLASVQAPDLVADFNGDGQTNSGDISSFLTAWLEAVQGGC